MLIGVDACCWSNRRGYGRFTRELLAAVLEIDDRNEYLFFIDKQSDSEHGFPEGVRKIVAQTSLSPMEAASADGRRSLRDLWAMTREVFRHDIDVFFFPSVYSYFPILNRARIVVTIHDLIADNHPELVFRNKKARFFWQMKQKAALRQAAMIATVSEFSKQQLKNRFKLPESQLRVISEAAQPVFKSVPLNNGAVDTLRQHGLEKEDRFLLYVGGISPHKNLGALISAFGRIAAQSDNPDLKLVLVGDYKDDPFFSAYPALRKQIAELAIEDRVIFTGFVEDQRLVYLYNAAKVLVFPSLEEGFGLPAIEAMACGTPVAASRSGSLPEVLGDAGRYFDPRDHDDMADTVLDILDDTALHARMKQAGLDRASQFRWEKAAEDTIRIFDELVAT